MSSFDKEIYTIYTSLKHNGMIQDGDDSAIKSLFDELVMKKYQRCLGPKLESMIDNAERVRFCKRNIPEIKTFIDTIFTNNDFKVKCKDAKLSSKNRTLGNKHYIVNNFKESIRYYTLAILYAPDSSGQSTEAFSSELASAYGNRSASFFHLAKFDLCIEDIDCALEAGHADKRKLLLRKTGSFIGLKRFVEANQLLDEIDPNGEDENCRVMRNKIDDKIDNFHPETTTKCADNFYLKGQRLNELLNNKVEVCYSADKGRHVKALEPLSIDDKIPVGFPEFTVLNPIYDLLFCHHCCVQLSIFAHLVPCNKCPNVLFCSSKCRNQSLFTYHQYECKYRHLLTRPDNTYYRQHVFNDRTHLALRILLSTGLEAAYQAVKRCNDSSISHSNGFNREEFVGFSAINNLPTHSDKINFKTIYLNAKWTWILLEILKDSGFLSKAPKLIENGKPFDWHKFAGGILFQLILQMEIWANGAQNYYVNESRVKPYTIFTSINPIICLFNHCCIPNGALYGVNMTRSSYIQILKSINPGEEIEISYNLVRAPFQNYKVRQESLFKDCYFKCTCWVCLNEVQQEKMWDKLEIDMAGFNPLACLKCCSMIVSTSNSDQFVCRNTACDSSPLTRIQVETRYRKLYRLFDNADFTLSDSLGFDLLTKVANEFHVDSMVRDKFTDQLLVNCHDACYKYDPFKVKSYSTLKYDSFDDILDIIRQMGFDTVLRFNKVIVLADVYFECVQESVFFKDKSKRLANIDECSQITRACLSFCKRFESKMAIANPFIPDDDFYNVMFACCFVTNYISKYSKRLASLEAMRSDLMKAKQ